MNKISLVIDWLVLSSKDSTKLSTTAWGSMIFVTALGISKIMGVEGIEEVGTQIDTVVISAGETIGAIIALMGALRKIKRTVAGTNAVLKDKTVN